MFWSFCWSARILGLFLAGLILLIFVGETLSGQGLGNPFKHPVEVQVELVAMFIAWSGLIVAWKRPGIGGLMTVGGIMLFHVIESKLWIGWVFGLMLLTGFLNLACWLIKKVAKTNV